MKTFDVYLNKRLTEIDVIITELIQRDTFSVYDILHILCSMGELEILKNISPETNVVLNTEIADLLEKVHEKIESEMLLKADVDFGSRVAADMESLMLMYAEKADPLLRSIAEGDSALEISVDYLDYYIGRSFGKCEFDMTLLMNRLETLKTGFEKFEKEITLDVKSDFMSQKNVGLDDLTMYLSASPTDIFYLLTIGGEAITNIYASELDEYVLKKVLHDVEAEMYLSASADELFGLIKYSGMSNSIRALIMMDTTLMQLINSAETEMFISCEASAGLKRYRRLEEIDDWTLADLDGMSLHEIDYVIIAE